MGKGKNKSFDGAKLESKLDKLLETIERNEVKATARHKDLTKRLDSIEMEVEKCKKHDRVMSDEITRLKASINALEQSKLETFVNIRGIPELEESSIDLTRVILALFQILSQSISDKHILNIQRIGKLRDGYTRPIVVQLSVKEVKDVLLKSAKNVPLNCSLFSFKSRIAGTSEQKIFLGHHLTRQNSTIFYEARKLRKKGIVKYAWVKDGQILIKKSEESKPIYLSSMDDVHNFLGKGRKSRIFNSTKKDHSKSETSSEESDDESDQDTAASDDEIEFVPEKEPTKKRSEGKRSASSPATTDQPLVQRPKRTNQKQ